MKKTLKQFLFLSGTALLYVSCSNKGIKYDASGVFETDEVIVSAEVAGKIISMPIEEGDLIKKDSLTVVIDAGNLALQKEQVQASIDALHEKTADVQPTLQLLQDQLSVQQAQMDNLVMERKRFTNLVKADAATPKQLDDINAQIDMLKRQMDVTRQQMKVQETNTGTQNRGVLSEQEPLAKKAEVIADQINRSQVLNPINGTILTKYAHQGEITGAGKALYKIADLSTLILRAYLTGDQLPQVKLRQQVTVYIDKDKGSYKPYKGEITWIADKAEFTPKTIQTKDERANLVYAIKIKVPNDGYLKIGMYGEVQFK